MRINNVPNLDQVLKGSEAAQNAEKRQIMMDDEQCLHCLGKDRLYHDCQTT
jgi:hypothetical protein